jgi:hypothetical protein
MTTADMSDPRVLDWPADRPLRLSGSPRGLRFPVRLSAAPEAARRCVTALVDVRHSSGEALIARSVTMGLAACNASTQTDTLQGEVVLRLDPLTPPGRYEGSVEIAGVSRPLEIDIVEDIKLAIRPAPLILDISSGCVQQRVAAFENRGNAPLQIDVSGEYALGEETPIPAREETTPGGGAEVFDVFLNLGRRPALQQVGTIGLAMPQGPFRLPAGETRAALIELTVPEELSPTLRHRAFVPIYNADLEIMVIRAAKQTPMRSTQPKTRGPKT